MNIGSVCGTSAVVSREKTRSGSRMQYKVLFVFFVCYRLLAITNAVPCGSSQFQCEEGNCIPSSWACDYDHDCPDGSDEDPSICPDNLKCSEGEFKCKDGHHCIPSRWKCDGENDCSDGSDEEASMCIHPREGCIHNDFACSAYICIPLNWVCDGAADCPDALDERNCPSNFTCTPDQFTCIEEKSKKCLPLTWVCDGTADCSNGSDERACNATCTSNEFTCKNGKCIESAWRCDGNNDCIDNSDEENCPSKTCTPGKDFMCKNDSICILASWRCDQELDCSDGSDEEGCNYRELTNGTSRCGKHEFECADHTCIRNSWVCDSEPDCPDESDENPSECPHLNVNCSPDKFLCHNLECIPGHLHCSGVAECSDGSDEENCGTPALPCDHKTQFDCGNGLCIPRDKVCDQKNDCGNWQDEPKEKCGMNECAVNNGNCSDLCVDTPEGYYCDCKSGFQLVGNYTCQDVNECEIPGMCSQTCINEKGTFKCECLEGYLRDPKDHTRCKAVEGHASLLFALRHDIRKISLDHLKMTLIVENTRSAAALDYMFRTGMIFWSDSHHGKIYKAPIDEGNAKTVVVEDELSTSDGLAIDWIYNHVYWTDSGKKRIAVAELDGKMRKVLIKDGLVEPRSIAVNPLDGWMYWTDWGVTPGRIERAGMDGSNRQVIVNTALKWPNGLTLDLVHKRIFWVDAKMNSISSSNYDGSDRRLVLQSPEALTHPFSITTFEDYVYWTDWANETIFKANKFTGKELTPILPPKSLKSVMSVHVYHAYRQPDGENHCTPLNGRCSHLCLPAPKINDRSPLISCACPDDLLLQPDGQNCAPDPALNVHHRAEEEEERGEEDENRINEMMAKNRPFGIYKNKTWSGGWDKNKSNRARDNNRVPAELSNEVQRIIPAESGMNKPQQSEQSPKGSISEADTGTVAGIVIGSLSALFVLVIVVVVVLYRHVFAKNGDSMNFDNPVYRKTTTEDHHISIEKTRFHKTYPATITEEAQQPLTGVALNVNEYV